MKVFFLVVVLNFICVDLCRVNFKIFFFLEIVFKFKVLKKVVQLVVINSLEKVSYNFFGIKILLIFGYECCCFQYFELKSYDLSDNFILIFRKNVLQYYEGNQKFEV